MAAESLYSQHERSFESNRYVYPVLSRRAAGISIGVNLNPDKVCNFDCIYCQVDRVEPGETSFVDMERLLDELDAALGLCTSGRLFEHSKFRQTPTDRRRLNDIAFSGDGEPTTFKNFDTIVSRCAALKSKHALPDVKMVLITNASMFHRPHVRRALEILDQNQGEIWAKLDAGTEDYYQLVNRAPFSFARILQNITEAARLRPLVIQSLFMRIQDQPPSEEEQEAFCRRLQEILDSAGQIKLVQIYTVARRPTESFVTPLEDAEVDALVRRVRERTGLNVAGYYGSLPDVEPPPSTARVESPSQADT
jgi:wyosine [tRNA(Phe)-imidazoG37] synthetase (radical SAM superfamily)